MPISPVELTSPVGYKIEGVYQWECGRCGHKWKSIKNYVVCPHCKSSDLMMDGERI